MSGVGALLLVLWAAGAFLLARALASERAGLLAAALLLIDPGAPLEGGLRDLVFAEAPAQPVLPPLSEDLAHLAYEARLFVDGPFCILLMVLLGLVLAAARRERAPAVVLLVVVGLLVAATATPWTSIGVDFGPEGGAVVRRLRCVAKPLLYALAGYGFDVGGRFAWRALRDPPPDFHPGRALGAAGFTAVTLWLVSDLMTLIPLALKTVTG